MMYRKILASGEKAQRKFLEGVNILDKFVGGTLGPGGRNRIIQEKYSSPRNINDGANIARKIILDDEIEDLAAQTLIEVAVKTAEQAGDGTSTSVVIASQIFRDGSEKLTQGSGLLEGENANAMALWRQINKEKDEAIKLLKKKSTKKFDLENVLATSLEDEEQGKKLAGLLKKVGTDGYISVEDNWATKYGLDTEVVSGMKFLGKYATPYLAQSKNKKEAIWEDALVLVTNHKIEAPQQIKGLFDQLKDKGQRKLVIIDGFSEGTNPYGNPFIQEVAKAMYAYAQGKDVFQILAVKAPSLTSVELEDVATFVGGKFIDKNLDLKLKDITLDNLGHAKKISVDDSEVNVIGGKGDTKERIGVLKTQLENEKDKMFAEKVKRRIASLSSGVGVIRVGAKTETERSHLKEKLQDAVSAAKAAMEEGIVRGGGIALSEVADEMPDAFIYKALKVPYERIQKNYGEKLEIADKIVDPTKVVRLALENACSGAGMLITTDAAIADRRKDFMDYMEKALKKAWPRDDSDDFRLEENRDKGVPDYVN